MEDWIKFIDYHNILTYTLFQRLRVVCLKGELPRKYNQNLRLKGGGFFIL